MAVYFLGPLKRERALFLIVPDSRCAGDTQGVVNRGALPEAGNWRALCNLEHVPGPAAQLDTTLDKNPVMAAQEAPLRALPASQSGHL